MLTQFIEIVASAIDISFTQLTDAVKYIEEQLAPLIEAVVKTTLF
jgi:hypothetical protein